MGDASYQTWNQCVFYQKDETTVIATVHNTALQAASSFMDAAGAVYTAANWPSSNTPLSVTTTANRLVLMIGYPTEAAWAALTYVKLVRTA